MIASALKKLLTQIHFPKKRKCRRACSKIRPILTRKTLRTLPMSVPVQPELMKRYNYLSDLFTTSSQNDDVQDFDVGMGSSSIISE